MFYSANLAAAAISTGTCVVVGALICVVVGMEGGMSLGVAALLAWKWPSRAPSLRVDLRQEQRQQ